MLYRQSYYSDFLIAWCLFLGSVFYSALLQNPLWTQTCALGGAGDTDSTAGGSASWWLPSGYHWEDSFSGLSVVTA